MVNVLSSDTGVVLFFAIKKTPMRPITLSLNSSNFRGWKRVLNGGSLHNYLPHPWSLGSGLSLVWQAVGLVVWPSWDWHYLPERLSSFSLVHWRVAVPSHRTRLACSVVFFLAPLRRSPTPQRKVHSGWTMPPNSLKKKVFWTKR